MPITDRRLAPGTVLVAKHKGTEYRAEVVQGQEGKPRYRLADGREFTSPSAAGQAITGGACNGWRFWSLAGEARPAARTHRAASRPTSPNVRRSGCAGPTAPTGRKAAATARTARKAAKRSSPAKAKGRKTARKATKRTAKAKKR